jgi:malate synthase
LTPEALAFVEELVREFAPTRAELLRRRVDRQKRIEAGEMPDFLPETADVRSGDWTVAPIPADLQDRRVEITGPVERKMVINALNSGANVFMADFEDSNSPTWNNSVEGQINLRDAVNGDITFTNPAGKHYSLNENTAVLMVRPRGWHLSEKHVLLDGEPIPASLFDFGLYFYHNARALLDNGTGPYFYLPKLQSHMEARLWNDVFVTAQDALGVPQGSIRATVLIETILAAFEMDEILYELPMTTHCMHSYSLLAIQTCHRRGIHAIGGMAAQIPIKNDPKANDEAIGKVRADKERESEDGHDGTWVAHPGLVSIAKDSFDARMPEPNQISKSRDDVRVTAKDLLQMPEGEISEQGLRHNINVGILYMAAWLAGNGCVPIYNLMEDAATAEISRSQIWQWIHHDNGVLADGRKVTKELCHELFDEELEKIKQLVGDEQFDSGPYTLARELIEGIVTDDDIVEFLTLIGYDHLK